MKGQKFYVDISDEFRGVIFLQGISGKGDPIRVI